MIRSYEDECYAAATRSRIRQEVSRGFRYIVVLESFAEELADVLRSDGWVIAQMIPDIHIDSTVIVVEPAPDVPDASD